MSSIFDLEQYQKERSELFRLRTEELSRDSGFLLRIIIKLSSGKIRSLEDASRILFLIFVFFLLISIYFFYRSQTVNVYEYLPKNFLEKNEKK